MHKLLALYLYKLDGDVMGLDINECHKVVFMCSCLGLHRAAYVGVDAMEDMGIFDIGIM